MFKFLKPAERQNLKWLHNDGGMLTKDDLRVTKCWRKNDKRVTRGWQTYWKMGWIKSWKPVPAYCMKFFGTIETYARHTSWTPVVTVKKIIWFVKKLKYVINLCCHVKSVSWDARDFHLNDCVGFQINADSWTLSTNRMSILKNQSESK